MRKETKNLKIDKDTFEALEEYKSKHGISTYNDVLKQFLGQQIRKKAVLPEAEQVPRFVLEVLIIEYLRNFPYSQRSDILDYVSFGLEELGWYKAKPKYFSDKGWRSPLVTALDNCLWRLFQNDIIEQAQRQSFDSMWSKENGSSKQYVLRAKYSESDSLAKNMEILIAIILPKVLLKEEHSYKQRLDEGDLIDDGDLVED